MLALVPLIAAAVGGIIASENKLNTPRVSEVVNTNGDVEVVDSEIVEPSIESELEEMVKNAKAGKSKQSKPTRMKERQAVPPKPKQSMASGAVITRPPVAIGSTLTGKRAIVKTVKTGHIIAGREFLAAAYGTGSITNWTMAAGIPLTPVTFVDSLIRQYGIMYSRFRWRKLAVHYVTTSPTTSNGSIMIYYNKDRASTFVNQTSTNLLPFVLSDPHTSVCPQWQSMTVVLEPDSEWKRTDYGMTADLTHYTAGEVFLLSKTSTIDSPGLLLMSYELEFKDLNLTPRMLLWPQPTIIYSPISCSIPVAGIGAPVRLNLGGTPPIGTNSINLQVGAVYKVILDISNSVFSGTTPVFNPATMWAIDVGSTTTIVPLVDGTTIYCTNSSSSLEFYINAEDAYGATNPIVWNSAITVGSSGPFLMWLSLVGFNNSINANPNM